MAIMDDKPLQARLPDAMFRAMDEWRRHQPDLPPRSEAARRLIDIGLKAARQQAETQKPPVSHQPR